MFFFGIADSDAYLTGFFVEGRDDIWRKGDCQLACRWLAHFQHAGGGLFCVPNGPLTSMADVGVSAFLLRAYDLGNSRKRRSTSGGIVIGDMPTREGRDREVENGRLEGRCDRAGTRKARDLVRLCCLAKGGSGSLIVDLCRPCRFRIAASQLGDLT